VMSGEEASRDTTWRSRSLPGGRFGEPPGTNGDRFPSAPCRRSLIRGQLQLVGTDRLVPLGGIPHNRCGRHLQHWIHQSL
jgi:hypothetical protein